MLIAARALFLLSFSCATATAVELSEISVTSRLNEPLQASISLEGSDPSISTQSLVVALASADAHVAAGIPFDKVLTRLIFTTDPVSDPPLVLVETVNPVMTPFLRFLLRVEAGEHRLFRDYTVMLDPADSATNGAAVTSGVVQSSLSTSNLSYPGEYIGPVRRGETLTQIARRIVVAGPLTLEQTMVALVEDNPEDFIEGNMNLLREGATLHVPSERRMSALDPEEARAIYESDLLRWLQRQSLATSAERSSTNWMTLHSPAPQRTDATTDLADEGSVNYILRIAQPAAEPPVRQTRSSEAAPVAQLRRPAVQEEAVSKGVSSEQAVAALTDRLSVVEASLGSKKLENDQLNQQVALLQQQLAKTLQLIELQETQLAIAQQQLQTMMAQESSTREDNSLLPTDSSKVDEALKESIVSDPAGQSTNSSEMLEARDDSPAVGSKVQTPALDTAKGLSLDGTLSEPVVSADGGAASEVGLGPATPPPPWIEPAQALAWLMFQGNYWIVEGRDLVRAVPEGFADGESMVPGVPQQTLFLLAAVLTLLWLLLWMRRRRILNTTSEDGAAIDGGSARRSLFEGPATQTQLDSGTGEPMPPEESVGAGFVTDIETQRGVAVQSDEVDPLTESEIYLAYGRSVQAEQTLRDAILRTPDRLELKLKLLEVLTVLARSSAFQELAAEVRGLVAAGSPEEAHLQKLIRDSELAGSDTASSLEAVPESAAIELSDQVMSNDMGTSSIEPPLASGADEGIAFEFDTDSRPASPPTAFVPDEKPKELKEELVLELEPRLAGAQFAETDPLDQGGRDSTASRPADLLAMGNESALASDRDDEEETQLELANAYLEMDDPAAAREILTDLSLSEDPAIKNRAQALLEKAGD